MLHPLWPPAGVIVSAAELSVEGWLASVAHLADEADRDPTDTILGPLGMLDVPDRRHVARCRADQEPTP